jgi:hypothetical protein
MEKKERLSEVSWLGFIHKSYEEWGEGNWCVCGCWLIQALKLVVEGNCFHTLKYLEVDYIMCTIESILFPVSNTINLLPL